MPTCLHPLIWIHQHRPSCLLVTDFTQPSDSWHTVWLCLGRNSFLKMLPSAENPASLPTYLQYCDTVPRLFVFLPVNFSEHISYQINFLSKIPESDKPSPRYAQTLPSRTQHNGGQEAPCCLSFGLGLTGPSFWKALHLAASAWTSDVHLNFPWCTELWVKHPHSSHGHLHLVPLKPVFPTVCQLCVHLTG